MAGPIDEARRLLREHFAAEALTQTGSVPASEAAVVRARALTMLERFDDAFSALLVLGSRKDLSDARRAEYQIVRARLLRRTSPLVDESIDLLRSALRLADRLPPPDKLSLAHEASMELARAYSRKRSRELAEAEIARAAELRPNDAETLCATAEMLVDFDDRMAAIERYRAACALGGMGERMGRMGWANVAMLVGQFDEAHALLNAMGAPRSGETMARRTRVRLLTAQQRWTDVVAAYDDMLRHNPGSDYSERDRYERACAMYRAGWFPHARAAFEELGQSSDRGYYIDLGRRNARLLARPDIGQRRWCRLTAFPTVAQLRSHCGPASCELYLRYFGVPASQVEVARAIKEPDSGTPVYRMRRFLEQAGFHTRRVEAELPLLRRLIDVQVPVIMEERYAQSGHVAVAIGYDDIRDILEVQDPMSHEVRETRYEELAKLRDMSNHGALIAVPRNDLARIAALDRIGAVECRYISLVDEAWAAMDEKRPEDGDRLVEESQRLRRDYELAWFYKFERATEKAQKERSSDNKLALFKIASEVAAIWPDQDWPEKLRGEALATDGRYSEALAAFERARDRDPDDPRTWVQIGACQMTLGRNDEAFDSLQQALRRSPSLPTANARLALLSFERGDFGRAAQLNEVARKLAPNLALTHFVHARLLVRKGDHEAALVPFNRALTLDPGKASAYVEQAQCLAKLGRIDAAVSSLEAAIKRLPTSSTIRLEVPRLLYDYGQLERAEREAAAILASDPNNAVATAIVGACRLGLGDVTKGIATLRAALVRRPTDAWIYTQMGRHFSAKGEHSHAIEAFATALGLSQGDAEREYDLGLALSAGGYADEASRHLIRAGTRGEIGEAELIRIGEAIVAAKQPARSFFERVLAKRPDDPDVLRAFARTMLELNWGPAVAMPLLARLSSIAPSDPYSRAYQGAMAMDRDLESEPKGEASLADAILAIPDREYPRRALAERLLQRGRYEEALTTLAPCKTHYQVVRLRVRSLIGLGRYDAVEEEFARFEKQWGKTGKESFGVRTLRFEMAMRKGEFAAALALAEQLSREEGERDDDGRLDAWELARFECMVRLGEMDRALKFGERQALDAPSLGKLGLLALDAGAVALATDLGQRALRLTPDNPGGTFLVTRSSELRGEPGAAAAMAALAAREKRWYRPQVAMVKMALALGDLPTAEKRSTQAVDVGHLQVDSFAVRAAYRLVAGDRPGAIKDLDRAFAVAGPAAREREFLDAWSLKAQIAGDAQGAERLCAAYLQGPVSPLDRTRIERLRALR